MARRSESTGLSVLILEDRADVVRPLAHDLETIALPADVARTTDEARLLLERNQYSFFILDLSLANTTAASEDAIRLMTELADHGLGPEMVVYSASKFPRLGDLVAADHYRMLEKGADSLWYLKHLIAQRRNLETLAGSLALRLRSLRTRVLYQQPSAPLGRPATRADDLRLPEDYRQRLATVDELPVRVLNSILLNPTYLHELTPRRFEECTAEILNALGFRDILLTPPSSDGGRDVIAGREVNGIPLTFYFECKKYAPYNRVQLSTLRALLGVVAHEAPRANIGVLVTTSTFTAGARALIASEARLDGKDYDDLLGWLRLVKELKAR